MEHGYGGEVIFAFIKLGNGYNAVDIARESEIFMKATETSLAAIKTQLAELAASNTKIAIWGGTGKSATFMQRYGCDAVRFPLVVDSDPDKADTFVPGTGQRIYFRDYLKEYPVDIIIIPPQWRAKDILLEMENEGIRCTTVLVEHQGMLVEFS